MRVMKRIAIVLLIILLPVAGLLGYLSATEYYPEVGAMEELDVRPGQDRDNETGTEKQSLRIVSWNIGYGALGDNADFFMDGGKGVKTADRDRLESNMQMIGEQLRALSPDVCFLQETDRSCARSSYVDEAERLTETFPEMDSSFANNFKVSFIPYPIPPIGKVDSGLLTLSALPVKQAQRLQLPCPFSWPIRIANLKRCLMLDRIALADGRELVLINLHLEAYDSGEGKVEQTKMLSRILAEEAAKGNPVIAGGDFNQIFSGMNRGQFPVYEGKWQPGEIDETQIEGEWQFLMDDQVPSCRSLDQPYAGADQDTFQYYLIDGFIVSGDLKVTSCETKDLGFVCSDHNPVVLEVEL